MSWGLIDKVQDFTDYSYHYWIRGVQLGYLIYFSKEEGITILDTRTLEVSYRDKSMRDNINYFINCDEIYFSSANGLFHFRSDTRSLREICGTSKEYISMLNNTYCMGRTVTRRPRAYEAEIISLSNKRVVYRWSDRSIPIYASEAESMIFEDKSKSLIKAINLENEKDVWSLSLEGSSIPRFYQSVSEDLFLVMQSYETDHPVDKRYELWGIDKANGEVRYKSEVDHFDRFVHSPEKQRLFGISGQKYMSVNPFTGKIESSKDIEELAGQWATLGRQSITEDDIFFIVSGKPMVGRFNILSETVVEFIEIPVDETKVDMRQPLDTPFYHSGRLYIRDNSGVMHILQRESNHPA